MIIIFAIIMLFAPQDNDNKELCASEYIIYKKRLKIILSIQAMIWGVTYLCNWDVIWQTMMLAQLLMFLLLIVGYIKMKCIKC